MDADNKKSIDLILICHPLWTTEYFDIGSHLVLNLSILNYEPSLLFNSENIVPQLVDDKENIDKVALWWTEVYLVAAWARLSPFRNDFTDFSQPEYKSRHFCTRPEISLFIRFLVDTLIDQSED